MANGKAKKNGHSPFSATPRPIGIDLFSGAGGMSLGFEQAGFDIVASVEIDPIHSAVHEYNFPNCATICASVSDVTGDEIRRRANIGRKAVDVVFGGAPCQGFSMIGKRALDDPRNRLVYDFVRIVVELKAKYFVFENVKGLTVGEHRKFLEELIQEFDKHDYKVLLPYRVLNAAEYGVPQDRRRLFLIGARKDCRVPAYPDAISTPAGKKAYEDFERPTGPSVWDALSDIPDAENFEGLKNSDKVIAKFGKPSRYAAHMRGLENDPDNLGYPRHWDPKYLTSSLRADHTQLSRSRFAATKHGDTEPISRFHKLDPKGVCNTLRAGTASDRGAFTSPRPIHPHYHRCITVREAARLHSYPDWFRFHGTKWHGFRQIGNSVPPLLARAVAAQIRSALGMKIEQPTVPVLLKDEELLWLDMSEAASKYAVSANVIAKRRRTQVSPPILAA